jgi:hypothetical protein
MPIVFFLTYCVTVWSLILASSVGSGNVAEELHEHSVIGARLALRADPLGPRVEALLVPLESNLPFASG